MNLVILGTRAEVPETLPYHSKHSGILVNKELLIDVGEKSFLDLHPKWILITHFHPDHAYFVEHGKEESPGINVPIYAPEVPEFLEKEVTVLDSKKKIGPYTVIPIPTIHSTHVKSQAYVIKKGKRSFLYTSDLVWIEKKYHSLIGKVDLVITEASFIRKGGMVKKNVITGQLFGHNGVPNLISLLKPFSNNFLFMHYGSWFYKDSKDAQKQLLALGKENGIHVIMGYDGLALDLDRMV